MGYRVLAAEDVDHGVRTVKEHPGPVHLLLTDVIMPHLSGMELYELIKPQRPEIKVLFMSGYTGNVIAHHGILEEGVNFIRKPFSLQALSQKVRQILDS
ncbi:MAG: response regulator [Deltaproteobacteria bacterium]|nr:response regulator [Deltaproteobacteria bacterium]